VRALVTGASGFLGGALLRRLRAEGIWVRALVRPGREASVSADDVCAGDLRDSSCLQNAVAGVDTVYHAGARVSTTGTWEEFEATNVRATEEIVALAAAAGVRRVVHVSSLSVYAVPHDGAVIREDSPYEAGGVERGFYARSKLAADQAAVRAGAGGAPVVIVRPGLLYGPGRRPPLARRALALGPLRVIPARRSYLLPLAYVDNVVDALRLAADLDVAVGRAYNLVDVHARQDEYARLYRQVSGQRWVAVYPPLWPMLAAVRIAERLASTAGRPSPVSRHQVERTVWSATFDTTRARTELGWEPRVALEEALRQTLAVNPAARPKGAPAVARTAA
jgi:nucleoside-diphosphate-sugar epimerase